MLKKLLEKIGIDRSEIKGFVIKFIDFTKLRKHKNVDFEQRGEVEHTLEDGNSFVKLRIKDNVWFGTFFAGIRKRNGGYVLDTYMDITIGDREIGNLNNVSVEEYKNRINLICQYLFEEYGVFVDRNNLRFKKLEINCTFEIREEFYKYHRALGLMMYNLPDTYEKITEVKKTNKKNISVESETFYRGNSCMQIKIYDKKRHLKDIGKCVIDENVMRIEIVLKNSQKIKEVFETTLIREITDDMVIDYYMEQFRKLFQVKYEKWRKENGKLLRQMIQSHKNKSWKNWQIDILNECRNLELQNRVPIILEIEDLLEQIKILEKGGHYSRVESAILKKCEENDVYLQQDSKKIEEIINKVNQIYDVYINTKNNVENTTTSGESI